MSRGLGCGCREMEPSARPGLGASPRPGAHAPMLARQRPGGGAARNVKAVRIGILYSVIRVEARHEPRRKTPRSEIAESAHTSAPSPTLTLTDRSTCRNNKAVTRPRGRCTLLPTVNSPTTSRPSQTRVNQNDHVQRTADVQGQSRWRIRFSRCDRHRPVHGTRFAVARQQSVVSASAGCAASKLRNWVQSRAQRKDRTADAPAGRA